MSKYTQNLTYRISDPYLYLGVQVLRQVFREIRCYYHRCGRLDEIKSGYECIRWVKRMDKNFKMYALVFEILFDMPVQKFHQVCLSEISKIKKEAVKKKLCQK